MNSRWQMVTLEIKKHEQIAVFDVFFRSIPDKGGYAIFAGLEQVIEYIQNLKLEKKK